MSLYYDAASIITTAQNTTGSLKSLVFGAKDVKTPPAQIYALVSESAKWSEVLKEVIENAEILKLEHKLTSATALVLTHDLLLTKRGIIAPAAHVLKAAITRHKARLSAEFTKLRLKRGFATIEAFRAEVNAAPSRDGVAKHPRWVRVNTLRSTTEKQLSSTFKDFKQETDLQNILAVAPDAKVLFKDPHIPNLLALPPGTDLSKSKAYLSGELILQDKASCFPAYLLDVAQCEGNVIDACAAPGNKTTHVTSILHDCESTGTDRRVFAFEKDKRRAETLRKMVKLAGAEKIVDIKGPKDFLEMNPSSKEMQDVQALLLDPSCSGSGIVGRDEASFSIELPTLSNAEPQAPRGKKRKRKAELATTSKKPPAKVAATADAVANDEETENPIEASADSAEALHTRLENLSTFQLHILKHAMRFPAARHITYSTCSIHFAENERVVFRALQSDVAIERGWRILKREEQVEGVKKWDIRGRLLEGEDGELKEWKKSERREVLEGCIRCEKGTGDGTMGFFVAAFVRDGDDTGEANAEAVVNHAENDASDGEDSEEEWAGFGD